jgi:hypothetical protein
VISLSVCTVHSSQTANTALKLSTHLIDRYCQDLKEEIKYVVSLPSNTTNARLNDPITATQSTGCLTAMKEATVTTMAKETIESSINDNCYVQIGMFLKQFC